MELSASSDPEETLNVYNCVYGGPQLYNYEQGETRRRIVRAEGLSCGPTTGVFIGISYGYEILVIAQYHRVTKRCLSPRHVFFFFFWRPVWVFPPQHLRLFRACLRPMSYPLRWERTITSHKREWPSFISFLP